MATNQTNHTPNYFQDNKRWEIDNPLADFSFDEIEQYADKFAEWIWKTPLQSEEQPNQEEPSNQEEQSNPEEEQSSSDDQPNSEDLSNPKEPSMSEKLSKPTTAQYKLFRKAGMVAKDGWKGAQLSKDDEAIFRQECNKGFWQQTKTLKVTIVTLCFSAIIQGWLQTGLNGANQVWPEQFGLQVRERSLLYWADTSSRWIFAGVNAITYLAASLLGCWLADPLQANYTGRRGAIFISGLVILASVVGASCAQNWQQLMICRALVGLGMGAKASVTPIFGAEVSPNHLRGMLVMNWQLFDAFGIFLGFTANLVVSKIGPLSWRFQMASVVFPTLCLLTLTLTIPESPRWLLKKGKIRQAFEAMTLLRDTPLQAATELLYANAQIQAEVLLFPSKTKESHGDKPSDPDIMTIFQSSVKKLSYWIRLRQLFNDGRTRRAVIASSVVMISQQLCGVNIIAFYSSTFFRDANGAKDDGMKALFLSWGVGLANFVFCFPAYLLIDTWGRRFLLLASYPGMIFSLLAASLSFLADDQTVRISLIGFFIFVFIMFYSFGQGPVPFAYSSEVFPLFNREVGMSFAVFVNLFGAGLLTLLVPLAQSTVGVNQGPQRNYNHEQSRLLGIFTGLSVLAFLLIFHFVPETKLAVEYVKKDERVLKYISLEELNYIFGVRTSDQVAYQWKQWTPWAFAYTKWKLRHLAHGRCDCQMPAELKPKSMYEWTNHRNVAPVHGAAIQIRQLTVTHCQHCHHVSFSESTQRDNNGHGPNNVATTDA